MTGNFHIPSVDLGIRSTVTYAYNYNKILKLYYPALYCYELVEADTHVEGRPVGSLYSYDFWERKMEYLMLLGLMEIKYP